MFVLLFNILFSAHCRETRYVYNMAEYTISGYCSRYGRNFIKLCMIYFNFQLISQSHRFFCLSIHIEPNVFPFFYYFILNCFLSSHGITFLLWDICLDIFEKKKFIEERFASTENFHQL